MNRRDFLHRLAAGAAAAAAGRAFAERVTRPNFVFILVDDLGTTDLGCYGSRFYETPNLDRFARTGVRFTAAYAAGSVCSPTRASILTGKYPARIGITDWIPGLDPKNRKLLGPQDLDHLPLEEVTIAEALKQAGYRTFFAGKWHLGGKGFYPEDQGFDINKGGYEAGSPRGGYYSPWKNPKLPNGPVGEYLTDRLTSEAVGFLEKNAPRSGGQRRFPPFFLYLSFYTVHTPIQACRRHLSRFEEKLKRMPSGSPEEDFRRERRGWTKLVQNDPRYASMVYAMDENVGRVLDKLDRLGLAGDTVVVFTSDNGGLSTLGRKWAPTSNEPFRAGKGWCYEGGIREPLLIRAPGITPPGTTCPVPVISTDFYPTLLELAGLPLRPRQHVDGVSLVPLLKGGKAPGPRDLFWHYPHYHGSTWAPGAAVRSGEWKLIEFYEEDKVELYNLKNDPGERHDLAATMPGKVAELRARLHRWQREVGAEFPRPNPNYDPASRVGTR